MKSGRSKGLTLSYLYLVLNTVIGIFMSAFIIRTVGQTDYGVYQSMTAFMSYLILLEFGMGSIMTRNISLCKKDGSEEKNIRKSTSTIWTVTLILGVAISVAAIVFWSVIDSVYAESLTPEQIVFGKKIFLFAAGTLIFGFITQPLNGFLIGYENYVFGKLIDTVKLVLRTGLLIVLLQWQQNVFLVVIVDFILSITCFVITFLYCVIKFHAKLIPKYFDRTVFRQMLPLAFAMMLQTIVNTANTSVDRFLISIMMTPENVSVYSVSMSMFSMFSSIATLPVTMFMPAIAKSIKAGLAGRELTETLVRPCRLNVLISGAVAFGFLCVGRPFVEIVFGDSYSASWLYAVIIMLPMFVNMTNAAAMNVLDVMRKRHVRSLILLGTTTINIILTIFAIKYIGMVGAAAATGLALILQTVLVNFYYSKKIGLSIGYLFKQSYEGLLIPYIAAACISLVVTSFLPNKYLQLFIGGIIFVAIFAVQYLTFGASSSEKAAIKKVLGRKARKIHKTKGNG